MPKNRHLSYSDRQADASRQKKQQQVTPPAAPSETPIPVKKSGAGKAPASKSKKS